MKMKFPIFTHSPAVLGRGACIVKRAIAVMLCAFLFSKVVAGVPLVLHFQGHIASAGASVDGAAEFKFALVDSDGLVSWSNSAIPDGGDQPGASISVDVDKGFYSVRLGDTTLANMDALTLLAFQANNVKLRVWFNDGTQGFERLLPDQPIAASAFAVSAHHAEIADVASTVQAIPDGLIGTRHLDQALALQIAETFAQVEDLQALRESIESRLSTLAAASIDPMDPFLIANGFKRFSSIDVASWGNGASAGAPLARYRHSAVWTGTELVVWGGTLSGDITGDGGRVYSAAADQWTEISPVDAPDDRRGHSAVWSGTEMIVFGGFGFPGYLGDGGRFNPTSLTWEAIEVLGAPSPRDGHRAVWTGSAMIVWGGRGGNGPLNDGSIYDPVANTWTPLSSFNAPEARIEFTMVWTGDRLLVWGGKDALGRPINSGAQLAFVAGVPGEWQPINPVGAPSARSLHSAVWTEQSMLVWGGQGSSLLNDGAAYDPVTGVWLPIAPVNAPIPRVLHSALWTGIEMLIHGGNTATGATATSHAYDPNSGQWRPLTLTGGPIPRSGSAAVWSGDQILVFGGRQNGIPVATLQRLNPRPAIHLYRVP
jgi:hypothetical protein